MPRLTLVLVLLSAAAASAATVHTVDDAVMSGDLLSITGGKLMLTAATTKPTTKPSSSANSRVPLVDIADVVLRAPPPPVVTPPANTARSRARTRSAFSSIVGSMFGGSSSSTATPAPAAAAEPTVVPGEWQLLLANGDRLHGPIKHWADRNVDLTWKPIGEVPLSIPADMVSELWQADRGTQAKARALSHEETADDTVFVHKDADTLTAVNGIALGIAGDALRLRYGDADRKIALAKVVGIIRHPKKSADGFCFTAKLTGGDTISGQWTGVDANHVTLLSGWGQNVPILTSVVARVTARGGRLTYLSDLKPARVEQVPYFGRVMPYRVDHSLTGGPMQLADGIHDKGVAVHSRCVLEYDLGGNFERFRSVVGFEQPAARSGIAALQVLLDGRAVYDNPLARGDAPVTKLDVDVSGGQRLALVVDFASQQDVEARVDWAEARLLRKKLPATQPTTQEGVR